MKTKKMIIVGIVVLLNSLNLSRAQDYTEIDAFIEGHREKFQRPKSCPLESKQFADLLSKIQSVKNTFENNCAEKDNEKLNEILNKFSDVEEELQKRNIITKSLENKITDTIASSSNQNSNSEDQQVDGVKISSLFNTVNSLIKRKQCNMEDGRILESTANLISETTQLGLVAGSTIGVEVAAGGFVLSSALKLIDILIKQRFDFEKAQDRQSFIKLNCAFYDIRSGLDNEGFFDIESSNSKNDLDEAKKYFEQINQRLKEIEEQKTQSTVLSKVDNEAFVKNYGDVQEIKKMLLRLKDTLNSLKVESQPEEVRKMLMITNLVKDFDTINFQLHRYTRMPISTIPMLDSLFIQDIQKFNVLTEGDFSEILKVPSKNFNEEIRTNLIFHTLRILGDIDAKEQENVESNSKFKKEIVGTMDKEKVELTKRLEAVTTIKNRLEKIVKKSYSATDDGADNVVSIVEDYKHVSGLIFGEWGEKFLKYTATKSDDEIENLGDKIDRFESKYEVTNLVPRINERSRHYMCQDAQRIRLGFKYSDSLVQEGYDFIVTNKDLFSSDVKNYYNQELNEEENSFGFNSSVEKIQKHYVSIVLALKKIKGEEIHPDDEDRYLNKSFFSFSTMLGKSMLDNEIIKERVRGVQKVYDSSNCSKIIRDDLNH